MAVLLLFHVLLSVLTGALCTVTTLENQEVLEGQSLTIPCHYNPQYKHNVKYWCRGYTKDFCTTLARTDDPGSSPLSKNKVTIVDDPTQNVFTVKMHDLKYEDSNWYRCGVEVGNMWTADVTANVYITVKNGMTVVDRTVTGQEGGSVSVKFIYSIKLREIEKMWCRSGSTNSCVVTDKNGNFSSRSLVINDDKMSTVTVTFKKLEMRDAGWYRCSAGQIQDSVEVVVTPGPTKTASPATAKMIGLVTPPPSGVNAVESRWYWIWVTAVIICSIFIILLVMTYVIWNYWKQQQNRMMPPTVEEQSALMVHSNTDKDWQNSSIIILNPSGQKYNIY